METTKGWNKVSFIYLCIAHWQLTHIWNNQNSYFSDADKRALQQKIADKNKEIEKLKEDANKKIECDIAASERLVRWKDISYLVDKK